MKKTKAEYWAPKIHGEWRKSIEGILGVGRQLIAAKESCEHGEFLRLFKGHENAVREPVPFGEDTAERLMKVASHPVLSDSALGRSLPMSWRTLYELTKLDDETLIAGIKSGEITPETTRAQAAALHADPVAREEKPPHEDLADRLDQAVAKYLDQLNSAKHFEYVVRRLEHLLRFLKEEESQRGYSKTITQRASRVAG
jgi:hypothetical protein